MEEIVYNWGERKWCNWGKKEENSLNQVFLDQIQNRVAAKIAQLGVARLRGTTVLGCIGIG